MPGYTFSYVGADPLAAGVSRAVQINDAGQLLGFYFDSNGVPHSYLYSNGTYTTIDAPDVESGSSSGLLLNNAGEILGESVVNSNVTHFFLYSIGTYIKIEDPLAASDNSFTTTVARGLNDAGEIVGFYNDGDGNEHGFLYSGGTYTTIDDPQAAPYQSYVATGPAVVTTTFATGINNVGQIVGQYADSSGSQHGFLYSGGTYITIDDPLAEPGSTYIVDINDSGQIVGDYRDGQGTVHGFLYSGGTYTTIDDPLAPTKTDTIIGINNAGQILGSYVNGQLLDFLYSGGVYAEISTSLAAAIGTSSVSVDDVNNAGQLVGQYFDSDGHEGTFVASPTTTTVPVPTNLKLVLASDSGIKGDSLTNVTRPLVIGFGEDGDTVTLLDGGNPIGTGTVAADGTWSVMPAGPLATGPHTLTATETDAAANTSAASAPLNLTIQTSTPAPTALALAPASDSGAKGDNLTNVTAPMIIGFGEDGDTVTLFDGNTQIGTGVVAADGSWSVTPSSPLAAGPHALTATETDAAANTSVASSPLDLTIKSSAPAPSGLALAPASDSGIQGDDITDVATPMIIGFGEAGDTVTLLDGNTPIGTGAVGADGSWSVTPVSLLAVGAHTLTATETDGAANTSAASSPLSLSIEAPASHVGPSGPDQFFYTGNDSQNVLGTSGDDTIWGNTSNSRIDGQAGNNTLGVQGNGNEVLAGDGNDLLIASGSGNLLDGGDGADSVIATGDHDTIDGGAGDDFLVLTGNFGSVHAGPGNDQVFITGDNNTVSLDDGNNLLALSGNNDWVDLGSGNDTVYATGNDLTIGSGSGAGLVYLSGGNATFLDRPSLYNDTVVGFGASAGDRIHLATDTPENALAHSAQVNGGLDTLIALADGSTILLKYVSHIDTSFFA